MFDTLLVFLKEFFKKVDFEKKNEQTTKRMQNYPACKEFKDQRIKPEATGLQ